MPRKTKKNTQQPASHKHSQSSSERNPHSTALSLWALPWPWRSPLPGVVPSGTVLLNAAPWMPNAAAQLLCFSAVAGHCVATGRAAALRGSAEGMPFRHHETQGKLAQGGSGLEKAHHACEDMLPPAATAASIQLGAAAAAAEGGMLRHPGIAALIGLHRACG